ncbi:MAG: Fe-S-containing protein [Acidobacteriota bacterium]
MSSAESPSRFRPWHGAVLIGLVMMGVAIYQVLPGGSDFERVSPDRQGVVEIDLAGLDPGAVRFFRFLNYGNQEVKFFVGRDSEGTVQAAFDANEICFKRKRGYRHDGEWMVCRVCDKAFRLAEVNDGGGGCKPVPLAHRLEGDRLVLQESEILRGWRYFR